MTLPRWKSFRHDLEQDHFIMYTYIRSRYLTFGGKTRKGKLIERLGRKATGLNPFGYGSRVAEVRVKAPILSIFLYRVEGNGFFMPLILRRFKKSIVTVLLVLLCASIYTQDCVAESVAIKGVMKIHRMGGYIILINYETRDRWTDSLLFRVHCKFKEAEFTFTSSSLNNLERGWHKTQIAISDVIKNRYGSLREYKVELYKNGVLVDTKETY